jgi:hypothetical protein
MPPAAVQASLDGVVEQLYAQLLQEVAEEVDTALGQAVHSLLEEELHLPAPLRSAMVPLGLHPTYGKAAVEGTNMDLRSPALLRAVLPLELSRPTAADSGNSRGTAPSVPAVPIIGEQHHRTAALAPPALISPGRASPEVRTAQRAASRTPLSAASFQRGTFGSPLGFDEWSQRSSQDGEEPAVQQALLGDRLGASTASAAYTSDFEADGGEEAEMASMAPTASSLTASVASVASTLLHEPSPDAVV